MLISISIPVPVSPSVAPGLAGGPSGCPVMLMVPPQAWAIMSKARFFSYGRALAEAFYLPVDDARIQLAEDVVAQAQALDGPGREILHENVGLARQLLDDLEPARGFQIEGNRALVGVVVQEIGIVPVRLRGARPAPGVAAVRILDLHHIGAEPRQDLRAGRAGLELRKVQYADALQAAGVE